MTHQINETLHVTPTIGFKKTSAHVFWSQLGICIISSELFSRIARAQSSCPWKEGEGRGRGREEGREGGERGKEEREG